VSCTLQAGAGPGALRVSTSVAPAVDSRGSKRSVMKSFAYSSACDTSGTKDGNCRRALNSSSFCRRCSKRRQSVHCTPRGTLQRHAQRKPGNAQSAWTRCACRTVLISSYAVVLSSWSSSTWTRCSMSPAHQCAPHGADITLHVCAQRTVLDIVGLQKVVLKRRAGQGEACASPRPQPCLGLAWRTRAIDELLRKVHGLLRLLCIQTR